MQDDTYTAIAGCIEAPTPQLRLTIADEDASQSWSLRVSGPLLAHQETLKFPALSRMTAKQAQSFFLAASDALSGKGPQVVTENDDCTDVISLLVYAASLAIRGGEASGAE